MVIKMWMILLDWLEGHQIVVRHLDYDDEGGATVEFEIGAKNFKIDKSGAEIWVNPNVHIWHKDYKAAARDVHKISLADPTFFETMDSLIMQAKLENNGP